MIDDEGPLPTDARATLAAIRARRVASEPGLIHHGAALLGGRAREVRRPIA
jgi:hypothetical protein